MKQKIARKILTVTSMLLSGVMVTATVICNENAPVFSRCKVLKTTFFLQKVMVKLKKALCSTRRRKNNDCK